MRSCSFHRWIGLVAAKLVALLAVAALLATALPAVAQQAQEQAPAAETPQPPQEQPAAKPVEEGKRRAALGVIVARALDGEGVRVVAVEPDSPAEKAGLHPGDHILTLDGQEIAAPRELSRLIRGKSPEDRVEMTFTREGEQRSAQVNLVERRKVFKPAEQPSEMQRPRRAWLGVLLTETEEQGVAVGRVFPESPAATAGLESNDVILRIGDTEVNTPEEVLDAVAKHKPGDKVTVVVRRGDEQREVEVELGSRREFFGRRLPWFGEDGSVPQFDMPEIPRLSESQMRAFREELADQQQRLEKLHQRMRREMKELRQQIEQLRAQSGQQQQ